MSAHRSLACTYVGGGGRRALGAQHRKPHRGALSRPSRKGACCMGGGGFGKGGLSPFAPSPRTVYCPPHLNSK